MSATPPRRVPPGMTTATRCSGPALLWLLGGAALAVALVVVAQRPASAQDLPTPAVSVTCPASVPSVARGPDSTASVECTFTASAAPDGAIAVKYRVSGAGYRSIEYEGQVDVTATGTADPVYFLRDTTAVTVRLLEGADYTLGDPSEATITVGSPPPRSTGAGLKVNEDGAFDGYTLITGNSHHRFYLIDNKGREAYRWDGVGALGVLLDSGNVLAGHTGGLAGGGVTEIGRDGTVAFEYTSSDLHHDVVKLANGNYLVIASAYYSNVDSIAAGANLDCLGDNGIEIDEIHEIEPSETDASGGTVVWKWSPWDHLIQDHDSSKANYGVVADHPELIDLNYGLCKWKASTSGFLKDPHHWTHMNGIDYNASLDQIMITSRHFSEVWVIDASTTTEQAAGSTGGNSKMGGDLLYRWGNPRASKSGSRVGQDLFFPHAAHWIPAGLEGEGNVLIYNNGHEHPGLVRPYASVDEVVFPASGHKYLRAGGAYMRPTHVWSYRLAQRTWIMSNAQRLPNGNTLLSEGNFSRITEITPSGEVVWHYVSPLARTLKAIPEGASTANPSDTWVYRAYKYPATHPGIQALTLTQESERVPLDESACVVAATSDELINLVRAYHNSNKDRADYDQNWLRVLIAFGAETSDTLEPFTVSEAAEAEESWSGWGPIREELVRLPCVPAAPRPSTAVPSVSISGGSGVTEGTAASFTITASPAPGAAITVNVSVTSAGGYAAAATRTVTIPTQGSATFSVATISDSVNEPDGSVTATVTTGTGYTVGSPSTATVTVADDDVPSVTVSGGSGVTEGASATFTITASPAPTAPITVNVSVTSVGAYAAAATRTVTVPTSGSATLTVATAGDSDDEPDGSVTVTVTTGTGYTVGSTSAATVTVADDDPDLPKVSISRGAFGVTEGASATFTLTASPAPAAAITVNVSVTSVGAYAAAATRTVTVPTSGSATLTVATAGDDADEPDGSVTATVTSGTGYTVGSTSAATVAVYDDDYPVPSVSISRGAFGVTEGASATFTLTASPAPAAAITVNVSVTSVGAYAAAATRTVTVPTSGSATLTVATAGDDADEPDGSVTATVTSGTGYTVGSTSAATVVVYDDDLPPPPPGPAPDVSFTAPSGGTSASLNGLGPFLARIRFASGAPAVPLRLPGACNTVGAVTYRLEKFSTTGSPLIDGLVFDPATRTISGTPTAGMNGVFRLIATDSGGTANGRIDTAEFVFRLGVYDLDDVTNTSVDCTSPAH